MENINEHKRTFSSERGDATIIEAIIIFPIVFMCVLFLIFTGFTFVQKAHLQSVADRLSEYLANCIMYPGYEDLVDPFYEKPKNTKPLERISIAMSDNDPYRYLFGLFSSHSGKGKLINEAESAMTKTYLRNFTFLRPSTKDVEYPPDIWAEKLEQNNSGYVCGIQADTSSVTVFLAQNFIFADFFKMIGVGNAKIIIYGKSTSIVSDCVEMVHLVDFAFDTIKDIAEKFGIDTQKIVDIINKLTGNKK